MKGQIKGIVSSYLCFNFKVPSTLVYLIFWCFCDCNHVCRGLFYELVPFMLIKSGLLG
jgi:hypothetical protein